MYRSQVICALFGLMIAPFCSCLERRIQTVWESSCSHQIVWSNPWNPFSIFRLSHRFWFCPSAAIWTSHWRFQLIERLRQQRPTLIAECQRFWWRTQRSSKSCLPLPSFALRSKRLRSILYISSYITDTLQHVRIASRLKKSSVKRIIPFRWFITNWLVDAFLSLCIASSSDDTELRRTMSTGWMKGATKAGLFYGCLAMDVRVTLPSNDAAVRYARRCWSRCSSARDVQRCHNNKS